MSVRANFADIYLGGMRDRSMRGGTESSELIGQQQENKANWFLWFRSRHHCGAIYFNFHKREKSRLSIAQITDQFKFFNLL